MLHYVFLTTYYKQRLFNVLVFAHLKKKITEYFLNSDCPFLVLRSLQNWGRCCTFENAIALEKAGRGP